MSGSRMEFLLAVDLGVKTGFALFGSDGRLHWYRSQNFGNKVRLKKAIPWLLNPDEEIDYLIIEGGGPLLKLWDAYLEKRNIEVVHIMAEEWRQGLLLEREQRRGKMAKEKALIYAGRIVDKLALKKSASLNIDAAEAILIGFWGMIRFGWIKNPGIILR